MTINEANELLNTAPIGEGPSRINPGITMTQAVEIVRKGINNGSPRILQRDGINLDPIFETRVHQVCRNQSRPRY